MLRRILTLLALLTGLAAAGAPAHAVVYNAASGVEVAAGTEKAGKAAARECRTATRQSLASPRKAEPCGARPTITVLIPTVQVGVDRAYE
ncbi:hypothetical protein [Qipengyuania flava]|uniref:hypothetical protein n=1 Tax=Qipengyuania flava TaxID=192812 RepID=UPI001C633383|nr:hypothetical protein [Qipengyuania flava]QYJ05872.1 hypothetical protein KUV82_07055 [Qipengyuania flava]